MTNWPRVRRARARRQRAVRLTTSTGRPVALFDLTCPFCGAVDGRHEPTCPMLRMPAAHTRGEDPSTSRDAAARVTPHLRSSQAAVLALLRQVGPCCDEVFRDHAERVGFLISPSGLRSRRAELVDLGLVADTGIRATLASGRHAIVWKAVTLP